MKNLLLVLLLLLIGCEEAPRCSIKVGTEVHIKGSPVTGVVSGVYYSCLIEVRYYTDNGFKYTKLEPREVEIVR